MARDALVELVKRPRYEVFPLPGIEDEVAEHVPRDVKMTVTSSPRRGLEATLRLSEQLSERGYDVVPHLSARLVVDGKQLSAIVERLRGAGVHDVFVVAGDAQHPAGEFADARELLAALSELEHPFDEVGVSGYPESHPFISDETTIQVMFEKAPFATYIVSQLCLDAQVIAGWIAAVRARGVTLPIHVGIAGVTPRRKLLRIATKIGVGESARFARKRGSMLGRLLLRGRLGPDYLVDALRPHLDEVAGFHVYTFNDVADTERWRLRTLDRLGRAAAA